MSKLCPLTGTTVLYLDCLECDNKICRQPNMNKDDAKNATNIQVNKKP